MEMLVEEEFNGLFIVGLIEIFLRKFK